MSDCLYSVAAAVYDSEREDSGEHCFLAVPEAEDLDVIQLWEAVSLLSLAAKVVVIFFHNRSFRTYIYSIPLTDTA